MTFNHPYCSNGGSGNVIPSVLPALNIVFLFKLSDAISRRDPAEFFRGLPTLASLGDSAMGEGGGVETATGGLRQHNGKRDGKGIHRTGYPMKTPFRLARRMTLAADFYRVSSIRNVFNGENFLMCRSQAGNSGSIICRVEKAGKLNSPSRVACNISDARNQDGLDLPRLLFSNFPRTVRISDVRSRRVASNRPLASIDHPTESTRQTACRITPIE